MGYVWLKSRGDEQSAICQAASLARYSTSWEQWARHRQGQDFEASQVSWAAFLFLGKKEHADNLFPFNSRQDTSICSRIRRLANKAAVNQIHVYKFYRPGSEYFPIISMQNTYHLLLTFAARLQKERCSSILLLLLLRLLITYTLRKRGHHLLAAIEAVLNCSTSFSARMLTE